MAPVSGRFQLASLHPSQPLGRSVSGFSTRGLGFLTCEMGMRAEPPRRGAEGRDMLSQRLLLKAHRPGHQVGAQL